MTTEVFAALRYSPAPPPLATAYNDGTRSAAYTAGQCARTVYAAADRNPHDRGSTAWFDWRCGWMNEDIRIMQRTRYGSDSPSAVRFEDCFTPHLGLGIRK